LTVTAKQAVTCLGNAAAVLCVASGAFGRYGYAMIWVRLVVGVLVGLLGLVWVGQGFDLLKGSVMTGQMQWAVIGVVLILLAAWLLWGVARERGWVGSAS
jgi:hypothetical protein